MSSLSSQRALVPAPLDAGRGATRGARRGPRVVRAGRSRSKKSASPIQRKKKKAGGAAVKSPAPPPPPANPNLGPVAPAPSRGKTLEEILKEDSPMQIITAPRELEDARLPPRRSGGGGDADSRFTREDDASPGSVGDASSGGGGWADALANFRNDAAAKETRRNAARREVLDDEESFFELGEGANFVDFGLGDAAVLSDDDDDDDDDDDASADLAVSDLEMRYREGQARGAVEFDLGEDLDDDGWDSDDDDDEGGGVRERGIPSEMRCFDTAKIFVKAGDGGRGMVAFRREAFVAQGGPYGGNGGNGGAIWFEADESINSLVGFRKKVHHRASPGGNGGGKKMQGKDGRDRVVFVPPGTVVRDGRDGAVLAEMFAHGHRKMVIPGGRGGRGNASFKTALNKAPQIAEHGEEGQELWVELELKLVADVGVIGVPNAGKSTLLSRVSNARPKIADYPFTTIVPNLGVVERDFERMVFADIPGLLEGASEGVGLGFEFLRHVKRTRVLVHVLDCTSEDVLEEYDAIRNELFLFDEEVGDKPELIALNKVDASDEAAARALRLRDVFANERGVDAHVVSALEGQGLNELVDAVKAVWERLPAPDYRVMAEAEKTLAKPADGKSLDDFVVRDTPYAFVVEGAAIERFVQMTNWDYFESFKRFARVLQMSGVERAINEAGAGEGDRVVIGKYEFEWSGDRREQALFDSWKAKQDEKPAGTTRQGTRHWPH